MDDLPSYAAIFRKNNNFTKSKNTFGEIEEIVDDVERRFNNFKSFDIIRRYPFDHHYLSYKLYNPKKIASWSSFSRRIEQEWKFLDKSSQSSVFIRAYEQQINLMRAAVVGPPGTPYHHCLFFFDIIYPRDYPSRPPKLYYHSDGIHFNQDLPSDGKICLNFLGQNEEWNPEGSHILQILQAVQDMMLSSKQIDFAKTSLFSSCVKSEQLEPEDMAFTLTCQKTIKIMKKPPKDFEDFVPGYFRKRGHYILLKFKENKYDSEAMIDLFVTMYKLFERNGAYCKHHLDFLRSQKQKTTADIEAIIRNLEEYQIDI